MSPLKFIMGSVLLFSHDAARREWRTKTTNESRKTAKPRPTFPVGLPIQLTDLYNKHKDQGIAAGIKLFDIEPLSIRLKLGQRWLRYEGFGALYKGLVLDSMKIGYEVPWLIVVAEDDLDSFLMEIQNSIRLSKQIVKDMRIDTHIPISYPTNCVRNEFYDILV
ncbi:hypothetical protein GQ457_05G021580 [Hibiscus cannabinus]